MEQGKDVERGTSSNQEELEQPFIRRQKVVAHEDDGSGKEFQNESIGMVLLSTGVAVCGSFQFGICVSSLEILYEHCVFSQRLRVDYIKNRLFCVFF